MNDDIRSQQDQVWKLIEEVRFAMLTHRHTDGRLHAHPLTTVNKTLEADGCLYFFVARHTEVGQRLAADGNVCLAYSHPGKDSYVSVTGSARVVEDMAKKRALYGPMVKAWFPDGPEDPDMELVEVRIEEAEYWDVKESKPTQLFKMAKAAVTGDRPDMGEHGEVKFR